MKIPEVIKTEQDVDEVAKFIKEQLKKAHAAGQEGIGTVHRDDTPDPPSRSELRFTFEHKGIKFSGCLYEPEIIGPILRAIITVTDKDF